LNFANKDKTKNITANFIKKNKEAIIYGEEMSIYPGLFIILVRLGYDMPQP
jgi:hypothetical protein